MRVKFLNLEWAGTNSTHVQLRKDFHSNTTPPKKRKKKEEEEEARKKREWFVSVTVWTLQINLRDFNRTIYLFFLWKFDLRGIICGSAFFTFQGARIPKQCIFGERKGRREKKNYWISEKNMETRRRRSGLKWLKPKFRASEYGGNPPPPPPRIV